VSQQVATATSAAQLPVLLADGDEQANILAKLLKQHIDAIVAADAAKITAALKIHGKLGLHSTEPEAEVTLVFDGAGVVIKNGMDADVDGRITGPLKLQTETLVGVANPYREMLRRTLKVGFKLSRPLFTSTTYAFLKVPPSLRPPKEA
jgi:hypothetical protein